MERHRGRLCDKNENKETYRGRQTDERKCDKKKHKIKMIILKAGEGKESGGEEIKSKKH